MKFSYYRGKWVSIRLTEEAAKKNGLEERTLTGKLTYHNVNGELRLCSHDNRRGVRIVKIPLTEIREVYDEHKTLIYP